MNEQQKAVPGAKPLTLAESATEFAKAEQSLVDLQAKRDKAAKELALMDEHIAQASRLRDGARKQLATHLFTTRDVR